MCHNWKGAKEFYINSGWLSGVSLEDAANKFNIPYQSVRRRAAKEQWRLIREWQETEPEITFDEFIYHYK